MLKVFGLEWHETMNDKMVAWDAKFSQELIIKKQYNNLIMVNVV